MYVAVLWLITLVFRLVFRAGENVLFLLSFTSASFVTAECVSNSSLIGKEVIEFRSRRKLLLHIEY